MLSPKGGLSCRHPEVGPDGHRALEEQRNPFVLRERFHRWQCGRIRDPEWGDGVHLFTTDMEHRPARDQDMKPRCARQEVAYERSRLEDLLEVVDDQEQLPIVPLLGGVHQRLVHGLANGERRRDRRRDDVPLRDRRELDEEGAVRVVGEALCCDLQGEPRLASPTRTCEGDEAGAIEELSSSGRR